MDATENAQPHVRAERQVILGRTPPDRQCLRTSPQRLNWFGETDEGVPFGRRSSNCLPDCSIYFAPDIH
jgi:hypothetical protein